ncbi:type 1 glutamine amidotransferase domain-containing protein [Paenibacillus glycanilyticus]|uniref:type 1 glutamine amidotransferase domain-containing protein n=1 Tax=Paenibacillus glycanilyticus TaxID=126569 RepID=UPI00203FAC98|nr:type 1 glutamine amidotransferase domain-containing protein [Paenibacillus glycanilyticus]MCM3629892.1 type 1 glutamine amidotransferase domain-containing protein [Paenibacillus glycanilyticus]
MTKKILMVLTNAEKLSEDERTGMWLSEFGEPYAAFRNKNYKITIASPLGGKAPIDHRSLEGTSQDMLDLIPLTEITVKLEQVKDIADYDAIFLPGGHGTMFDLPGNKLLQSMISTLYEAGKPVVAVCHGPAGLVEVKLSDGSSLISGKKVAVFTDEEESETGLAKYMPFLLESRFRELGASVIAAPNWTDNVQVDGNLITGQNPQSAESAAKALIEMLEG